MLPKKPIPKKKNLPNKRIHLQTNLIVIFVVDLTIVQQKFLTYVKTTILEMHKYANTDTLV